MVNKTLLILVALISAVLLIGAASLILRPASNDPLVTLPDDARTEDGRLVKDVPFHHMIQNTNGTWHIID